MRRAAAAVCALAALAAAVTACGAPRPPAAPPPRTVADAGSGEPAATAQSTAQPEPPAVTEPRPPEPYVVIEPAEPEAGSEPTLAEAALRERQRRAAAGQPIAVITDANLQEHAVGQLTFMEDEAAESAESPAEGTADGEATAEGPDEQYWRDRVRAIRERWADAAARVPALEQNVAELRRRFYEADDVYYRDSRIKPAWDRAIDLIAQTRAEAEAHRAELEAALAEGRRAGALPGWLREGIELEPAPLPLADDDTAEPGEPVIVEPVEGGGTP